MDHQINNNNNNLTP